MPQIAAAALPAVLGAEAAAVGAGAATAGAAGAATAAGVGEAAALGAGGVGAIGGGGAAAAGAEGAAAGGFTLPSSLSAAQFGMRGASLARHMGMGGDEGNDYGSGPGRFGEAVASFEQGAANTYVDPGYTS